MEVASSSGSPDFQEQWLRAQVFRQELISMAWNQKAQCQQPPAGGGDRWGQEGEEAQDSRAGPWRKEAFAFAVWLGALLAKQRA